MAAERAMTVRLPVDLHVRLHERAAKEDRTVASILRLAARQYLDAADDADSAAGQGARREGSGQ